ncbi:MAG: ATP-dependent Clp protease ATP-binding subunit [Oscillospiraceae bacterium]|nr:ATP-dependent Clp protease ATP-binding subunit [Oscillospiraceae bacterium]
MRFENKLTERAKGAVSLACSAAAEMGHGYVGSEHLLIGLAREGGGAASGFLRCRGFEADKTVQLVEKAVGRGVPSGRPAQGFTPNVRIIIELAASEAARMGQLAIGTEHLLMGMLKEKENTAVRLLAMNGADIGKMYSELTESAGGGHGDFSPAGRNVSDVQTPSKAAQCSDILSKYTRDLVAAASLGELDPVICRDREISRAMQILTRRSKNNPVLIGEPGVGKTAVVEALAQRICDGSVPDDLRSKKILTLDLCAVVAGTKYRGDFEDRLKSIIEAAEKNSGTILFIDELHTLMGAGAAEGSLDAANIIKPAIGRGELQIIGATTINEYRRHIEKDPALERRFQPVTVNEPGVSDTVSILTALRPKYEAHHKTAISDEAVKAAVELSGRYINDRFLPDKAIDLIDEAASAVRISGLTKPDEIKELESRLASVQSEKIQAAEKQEYENAAAMRDEEARLLEKLRQLRAAREENGDEEICVTAEDVAKVVSLWTGIPLEMINSDESRRLKDMESILHRRVVGQDAAVGAIARAVRRGRVGLGDPRRPIGTFLLLGPTGVGKTELCRALAEVLFGDEKALIKLDMSEYMERNSAARLTGAPPGYVGYDEGGQLTEKVRRRPYSVVLFDEIEKAHTDITNMLLQITEDGVLTDSQGRRADFRNSVIIMTSNLGSKSITENRCALGFSAEARDCVGDVSGRVMEEVRALFSPEFINRIDEIIVFEKLDMQQLKEIARVMLGGVIQRFGALGIRLEISDSALEELAKQSYDPRYGARPLRRAIRTCLEDAAAEMLISGELAPGDLASVNTENGKIILRVEKQCA